jgi:polyhydroxybutyrate depolymerase
MRARWALLVGMGTSCKAVDDSAPVEPSADADADADTDSDTDSDTVGSAGCGAPGGYPAGGVQLTLDAGPAGDGVRSFWLSLPADYDPAVPHRVVIGYPGTDWIGEWIQPYLDLENQPGPPTIFVYPDPLWRDFPGWGTYGGWVLGPHAYPADGDGDLVFTGALLDWLESELCVDPGRVFVTGHSWGGDMAQVVSCFLGDRVRASVPVAANEPYWFDAGADWAECVGQTAVWTMFGVADDHFTWQDYPGQFGDMCVDFWLDARGCDAADPVDLGYGADGECVSYAGCGPEVRYCLYGPATGHQVPWYYAEATMAWFATW